MKGFRVYWPKIKDCFFSRADIVSPWHRANTEPAFAGRAEPGKEKERI
jgi:hypothetical protein